MSHQSRTAVASADSALANDELLTITEAAAILRTPVATLRYWRHIGTGPHSFRIGRSVRYWRTEVALWLEEQSRNPQGRL